MKLDDVRKIAIKSVKSENEVSGASKFITRAKEPKREGFPPSFTRGKSYILVCACII